MGSLLQPLTVTNQLIPVAHRDQFTPLYRELARKEFATLVEAEHVRAPQASILYVAALPAIKVLPDPDNAKLCCIQATWGESFGYALPSITTNEE